MRQGALLAFTFDPTSGMVRGEPAVIAQGFAGGIGSMATSNTGVLAYRTGTAQRRQLVWVNRGGAVLSQVGDVDAGDLGSPELSPDEQSVVVFRHPTGDNDIWLIELGRNLARRVTDGPPADAHPMWDPDGQHVIFNSSRLGPHGPVRQSLADGKAESLFPGGARGLALAWTRDRRFILLRRENQKTGADLIAVTTTGEPREVVVAQSSADETEGQFSPDGRSVAFVSNSSGRPEVFVQSFPDGLARTQVSTGGGAQVRWSNDGKEIFYVAPDGKMMAVSVAFGGPAPTVKLPVALFQTHLATGTNVLGNKPQYAVARDGRFLLEHGHRERQLADRRLGELDEEALAVRRRALPGESGFQIGVREAEAADRLTKRLTIGEVVQQPRPAKAGPVGHDFHSQQAFVVGHVRFCGAHVPEAVLEVLQWNGSAEGLHPSPGCLWIGPVEVLRQPFVEPRRHAAWNDARDHGMGQLVRQHMLEQFGRLRGAATGIRIRPSYCPPDQFGARVMSRNCCSVYRTATMVFEGYSPSASPIRKNAELKTLVACAASDSSARPSNITRSLSKRLLRERLMDAGVPAPRFQRARKIAVAGRPLERLLICANRQVHLSLVERDMAEELCGVEQPGVHIERPRQMGDRVFLIAPLVRRDAGAHQEHGIVRPEGERFGKYRRRLAAVAVAKRLPAGIVQLAYRDWALRAGSHSAMTHSVATVRRKSMSSTSASAMPGRLLRQNRETPRHR